MMPGRLTQFVLRILCGLFVCAAAHLWRGFFALFDVQHVNNPGYNQARGPAVIPAVRFHADF